MKIPARFAHILGLGLATLLGSSGCSAPAQDSTEEEVTATEQEIRNGTVVLRKGVVELSTT